MNKSLISKSAAPRVPLVLQPAPLDPQTLLGNPARMFPAPLTQPLNLDAAFAAGIPDDIPYPFAESAGPYIPAHYAADYQAWLDFTGIVTMPTSTVPSSTFSSTLWLKFR